VPVENCAMLYCRLFRETKAVEGPFAAEGPLAVDEDTGTGMDAMCALRAVMGTGLRLPSHARIRVSRIVCTGGCCTPS